MRMPSDETDWWPRFTLVTYSQPTGIPHGWDEELLATGAPDGLMVKAIYKLVLLEDPKAGPLVCFGSASPHQYICLNPRNKHIMDIVLSQPIETDNSIAKVVRSAWLVNTTLDQFIASARMVTARFPFDSEGAEDDYGADDDEDECSREDRLDDERTQAAAELVEALRRIDPAAVADPDSFWMTFRDDMQMGNYSAKDMLNSRHQ
ncbi:MAG TPA: SUKH-4 family immunity protein [Ktedonobacterales bacterium]|nr:SUKH-4 family immunity protein [Ktedonobacterales bacterium]